MGKTIYVGNGAQSELLVFRLVQIPSTADAGNSSVDVNDTVYVVMENNADDLDNNSGRFMPRVARI
jgi:hypothetical protein